MRSLAPLLWVQYEGRRQQGIWRWDKGQMWHLENRQKAQDYSWNSFSINSLSIQFSLIAAASPTACVMIWKLVWRGNEMCLFACNSCGSILLFELEMMSKTLKTDCFWNIQKEVWYLCENIKENVNLIDVVNRVSKSKQPLLWAWQYSQPSSN